MSSVIPFKLTPRILLALAVLILGVGFGLGKYLGGSSLEGFTEEGMSGIPQCSKCKKRASKCACTPKGMARLICPPCQAPDLSKYVLKSSIPKQQPVIIDNSACKKDAGECPPCPRPRCPTVTCPPQVACPAPAPCPRTVCPTTTVKCKADPQYNDTVRPFLSPLNMNPYGR